MTLEPTPEQIEAERPYAIMIVGRSIPEISTALALTRLEGIATGRAQMEAKNERMRAALKRISVMTETDHIGDEWLTPAAEIALNTLEGM